MRADKYLSQVQDIYMRIDSVQRSIKRIDELLITAGVSEYGKERVIGGSRGNRIEDNIVKKERYEKKLQRLCFEGIALISKITDQLSKLSPLHSAILGMRYIECMDFEDIGHELHYAKGSVYNQHGWALREFEKKFFKNKSDEKK